jgi:hypothetical protein
MIKNTYTARRIRMCQMMMAMVILSQAEMNCSDFNKILLYRNEPCIRVHIFIKKHTNINNIIGKVIIFYLFKFKTPKGVNTTRNDLKI